MKFLVTTVLSFLALIASAQDKSVNVATQLLDAIDQEDAASICSFNKFSFNPSDSLWESQDGAKILFRLRPNGVGVEKVILYPSSKSDVKSGLKSIRFQEVNPDAVSLPVNGKASALYKRGSSYCTLLSSPRSLLFFKSHK